ncbi:MAG TPA: VTT domain-containing protein [Usitatibacter sp.]|nr:VTT domain-containing protein [Usitatibacter sp.]
MSLFRPGENCEAVATAQRAAFIVDAEDYFRHFMRACERAERDILILGWDFDSRTIIEQGEGREPVRLGDFLDRLAQANRHLRIRILDWDYPMVFGTDREIPPTLGIAWKPHGHIDFRFDDTHPVAGSHHQKIVVVDGCFAFSGGLDLTNKRWDTRRHEANDPRRVHEGTPYPPFHDVMIAVDGEAARELGKVARERWKSATGEALAAPRARSDPWPEGLRVDASNAPVAISLTAPRTEASPGTRQVEQLYLDMIAAAKKSIYIENQYFTSRSLGAALAARLAEAEGPEIVVVTRLLSHGWLEEITMTTLRVKLVRELRKADRHGRFHAYYPHVPGLAEGTCLDIHSKVMVVDDEWARVGSANLSNRSMGMDTECDVTLEARGEAKLAAAVASFRDCLLAEHMAAQEEEIANAIRESGSIAAAVHALARGEKGLKRLQAPAPSETEIALAQVGDPGEPIFEPVVELPQTPVREARLPRRRMAIALATLVVAAIALALVWTHTPLKDYLTRDTATRISSAVTGLWWAPLLVVLAYTPASFIMFPRWIITMTAVLAFGAWQGFALAFAGVILAGIATFTPGRLVDRETVRRLAGKRLRPLTRFMENRGLLAVTIVRLVPLAPFPVVNLVMGAMRVKPWHFVLGTFLGMLPGMLAATVLSDQLAAALEDPSRVSWWIVAAAVATFAALAWFGHRMMHRHR